MYKIRRGGFPARKSLGKRAHHRSEMEAINRRALVIGLVLSAVILLVIIGSVFY